MALRFENDAWYSAEDVARLTGWSKSTLALWRTKGGGPKYSKLGRAIWYRGEDLERFYTNGIRASTLEDGRPTIARVGARS